MKGFTGFQRIVAYSLALLLFLLPGVAMAVSLSAEANKKSVQAGDTVEVTITLKGSGMAVAEGSFTYDPALLTYAESEGGASDGFLHMVSAAKGGTDTLVARIRFTAAAGGTAKIEASIEKVLGYNGEEQGGAKADVSVSVAAPAPTPTPKPISYAAKGVPAANVQGAAESMYVWRTLENVTVPSRYSEVTLTYHGETVAAAKVEDSDAPTLLYLSNDVGDVGGYYVYEEAGDVLYPYQTISSVSKSYILLTPNGSVEPPAGFGETTLMVGEREYRAWKSQDAQGGIYLLYARNPDGEVGYYVYNPEDESLQRYAVMPARPSAPEPLPEDAIAPAQTDVPSPGVTIVPEQDAAKPGEITLSRGVFYAICCAGIFLLLIVLALLTARIIDEVRYRRKAARLRAERIRAREEDIGQ